MGRLLRYERVEHLRQLDVRRLQRDGALHPFGEAVLRWSRAGSATASLKVLPTRCEAGRTLCIDLAYRHGRGGGRVEDLRYSVHLEWTRCNFGGWRPWFLCPTVGCGRRVAILYGGGVFACRSCHKLRYSSQLESRAERMLTRLGKVRSLLVQ